MSSDSATNCTGDSGCSRVQACAAGTKTAAPGRRAAVIIANAATTLVVRLRKLVDLPFGLDRRSDDHFGLLELADGVRPAHSHRGLQRANQVLGPVCAARWAKQRLLDGGT